jgi:hypothetical protein
VDKCHEIIDNFTINYSEMYDAKIASFATELIEAANCAPQNEIVLACFAFMRHFSTLNIYSPRSSFITNPNFNSIANCAEMRNLLTYFYLDTNFFHSISMETSQTDYDFDHTFNHTDIIHTLVNLEIITLYNEAFEMRPRYDLNAKRIFSHSCTKDE